MGLIDSSVDGLHRFAFVGPLDKAEYALLVVRKLHTQRVDLRCRVSGGGAILPMLREVWVGSRVSSASAKLPPPPHLLTPDAMLHLECPPGQQLRLTKRDGETLFDQRGNVPESLRKYFGRPGLTLGDLIDTGHISMAELAPHSHKNVPLRPTTFVYLVSRVRPMGNSWSTFIARNCMLAVCRAAMLTNDKCLSVDLPLPKCLSESFGLATDDLGRFTTRGMEHAEEVGDRIDRAFRRLGIRSHQTKRATGALDGTCIGTDLFKGTVCPALHKLAQLLHALSLLVDSDSPVKVSPIGL